MRIALGTGMILAGAVLTAGSLFLPTRASIAESGAPVKALPVLTTAAFVADPRIADDPSLLTDDNVTFATHALVTSAARLTDEAKPTDEAEVECVAKVVHHEASNQSRRGQLAVAQIIVNRAHSGRFPTTMCAVANQPGQFFNTASYNPSRDTARWQIAMDVSREAVSGGADDVTNGAYFYHAAYQAPTRFFQSRQRVQTLGDHVFYR